MGASIDKKCPDGSTALRVACENGHVDAVRVLIKSGASIDADLDRTLEWAVRNGHMDVVSLLVEFGVNMELTDKSGWNALMRASERGHLNIVETLLLRNGALVDKPGPNGSTALNIACEHDQLAAVVFLVNFGANIELPDDAGYTPVITAAQLGHSDVVQFLVTRGANVNARLPSGGTALLTAVWYKRLAVVRILLDNGADINLCGDFQSWPALTAAYISGYTEFTQLIYECVEPDFDFSGDEPSVCVNSDTPTSVGTSFGRKHRSGDTALRIACEQGNMVTVKKLLEFCDDVNLPDDNGWTPLMSSW